MKTFDLIERAETKETAEEAFFAFALRYGFDALACGELNLDRRNRSVFHSIRWPEGYAEFYYTDARFNRDDPIQRAMQERMEPFAWSDLETDQVALTHVRQSIRQTRQFGWSEGFVVPIARLGERLSLVSLKGNRPPIEAGERDILAKVARLFHARISDLTRYQRPVFIAAGLSGRELDCLECAANGHSNVEIATMLGIAETTVRSHLDRARERLSAQSRSHTIAIAIATGIVHPKL